MADSRRASELVESRTGGAASALRRPRGYRVKLALTCTLLQAWTRSAGATPAWTAAQLPLPGLDPLQLLVYLYRKSHPFSASPARRVPVVESSAGSHFSVIPDPVWRDRIDYSTRLSIYITSSLIDTLLLAWRRQVFFTLTLVQGPQYIETSIDPAKAIHRRSFFTSSLPRFTI
jgi:hypothetical protein